MIWVLVYIAMVFVTAWLLGKSERQEKPLDNCTDSICTAICLLWPITLSLVALMVVWNVLNAATKFVRNKPK